MFYDVNLIPKEDYKRRYIVIESSDIVVGIFSKESPTGERPLPYESMVWVTDSKLDSIKFAYWMEKNWIMVVVLSGIITLCIIIILCKLSISIARS